MAAEDALSKPLFHGTAHDLEGDTLRPGVKMGISSYDDPHKHRGQSVKDVVSATGREGTAWWAASKSGPGRARVLTVEPNAQTKVGVENEAHPVYQEHNHGKVWHSYHIMDNDEYVAPHFKVTGQIDIKPGHQGTFPQVDWNKHGQQRRIFASDEPVDFNHPRPVQSHELTPGGRVRPRTWNDAMAEDRARERAHKYPLFHDRRGGLKGEQGALF